MDKTTEDEFTESTIGMTAVDASRATPQDRLAWTRGHRLVERHHPVRDVTFKEDDWTARTRSAPSNSAIINTIAIAVILGDNRKIGKPKRGFAESPRAFSYRRKDGMKALFTPLRPRPLSRNHDTTGVSAARTTRRLSPGSPDRQRPAPHRPADPGPTRREGPIRAVDHISR